MRMLHCSLLQNSGIEFRFMPFLMFFGRKALRYLSIVVLCITVFTLVGCGDKETPPQNKLNRSDSEIKQLNEKLSKVRPGDLLVKIDAKDNLRAVHTMVRIPRHGITMEGIRVMCSGAPYALSTHGYDHYFMEHGDVYIVPREKAKEFLSNNQNRRT